MKTARLILALLGMGLISTVVLAFQANDPPAKAKDIKGEVIKEKLSLEEQRILSQFNDFQQSILKLKQRLERSGKKEDADKAKVLEKVLERIRDASLSAKFEQLVEFINKTSFTNIGDVKRALEDSRRLADELRAIIDLMQQGSAASRLSEARAELQKIIKDIEAAIRNQQITQTVTDIQRTKKDDLGKMQARNTAEVAAILDKIKKYGQGSEGKDMKGNAKDAGKGGKQGETKGAGKEGSENKGQAKEGQGADKNKPSEAKPGDKGGKSGDGQASEAKGGKGSDGKEGGAKGSKAGEGAQAGSKDNKGGEKKEGGAKDSGEKSSLKEKTAEAKGAEKKDGEQSSAKSGKGGEGGAKGSKAGEGAQSESKSGGKGSESKQGESKSGSQSQGQSSSKDGGQQGDQNAQDKQGQQNNNNQPQDITQGKKKVQDANYDQKKAGDNIAKNQPKDASDDQGKAIQKLEEAKKKLEELLRQMREEELERLLAALEARCQKMLAMQIEVLVGTEGVHKGIEGMADKKATREHKIDSLKLSDKEKDIVLEATKAIEMLEAEGSAVAFPEVFQQVREDMKHVQRRLEITDAGVVTQAIEKDIIDTLKEMIDALKKAQQEIQNKKNPPPGKPPPPNPNADQKLLDQIAELKMIRSMQLRVNTRTTTYGRMYPGEQAKEPNIRQEVIQLSNRQERIFDVTNRIAKGDNK